MPALAKESAVEAAQKKKEKEKKDSRNLHLASEGLVRAGTLAAKGVSQQDMAERLRVERWKRSRLKDLNMFVSPHRLCVRNLPEEMTDKELKALAGKRAPRGARITEVRIIRDMAKVQGKEGEKKIFI